MPGRRGVTALIIATTLLLLIGAVGRARAQTGTATPGTSSGARAEAKLVDLTGKDTGHAVITESDQGLLIEFDGLTLPAGDYDQHFFDGQSCADLSNDLGAATPMPVAHLTEGTSFKVGIATPGAGTMTRGDGASPTARVTIADAKVADLLTSKGTVLAISDVIQMSVVACGSVTLPTEGTPAA